MFQAGNHKQFRKLKTVVGVQDRTQKDYTSQPVQERPVKLEPVHLLEQPVEKRRIISIRAHQQVEMNPGTQTLVHQADVSELIQSSAAAGQDNMPQHLTPLRIPKSFTASLMGILSAHLQKWQGAHESHTTHNKLHDKSTNQIYTQNQDTTQNDFLQQSGYDHSRVGYLQKSQKQSYNEQQFYIENTYRENNIDEERDEIN